jgi:hypothetical protein
MRIEYRKDDAPRPGNVAAPARKCAPLFVFQNRWYTRCVIEPGRKRSSAWPSARRIGVAIRRAKQSGAHRLTRKRASHTKPRVGGGDEELAREYWLCTSWEIGGRTAKPLNP